MSQKQNRTVVFALTGRALAAAQRLEEELKKELETTKVLNSGSFKDIGDSWDALYEKLIARLEKEAPEVLKLTGLTSPAVQVFQGVQTLPRAYREYPQIFTSPEKKPAYFMYAPVDYKGEHFIPLDSLQLTPKQESKIGDLLFAGGWLGNAPIVNIKKSGVETPAGYTPPSKTELRKAFSYIPNDRVCFLAGGRSLELIEDYRARQKDWESSIKAACREIEALATEKKDEILADLPFGEDVRISATYSYSSGGGDKATLLLSVRRAGKDSIWNSGKSVDAPRSPGYQLSRRDGGEYKVTPRRDTPEGEKFAALFDAIPLTPGLKDYPELFAQYDIKQDKIGQFLGVNGTVPQVVDVAGYTVLLYNAAPKDKKKDFCPPGATRFPTEAYEWLRSDEGDCNMGVTPPPMPAMLKTLLREAAAKNAPATPKPPSPPKP